MKRKVRIACVVAADGMYSAAGWSGTPLTQDNDVLEAAYVAMEGAPEPFKVYWITATVDIPAAEEIDGSVEGT